jgi:tetratricopeptide (TPR) repeat protein
LPEIVITPEEAACATDAALDDHAVCSLPWPTQWPLKRPSEPDEKYYLQVGARLGIAAPLRRSESSALEVLSATAAEGLQSDKEAILGLDLDVVTEALLLGGISAAAGDYTTAIAAYRTALAVQPTPIVSVALGDLYRAVDLQRFAFAAYAEALQMLDEGGGDQAVRAAAEFGQGQVEFAFENYDHAAGHYEQAIALYREVDGADEALAAAQLALQTALDRQ